MYLVHETNLAWSSEEKEKHFRLTRWNWNKSGVWKDIGKSMRESEMKEKESGDSMIAFFP